MTMPPQNYETFMGSALAGPIFALVEKLEDGRGKTNEVQSSPYEHGYSASTIALTVLFLESYLNVSKYLTASHERSVRAYFHSTFPHSIHRDELAELFAVRDVIAHNHVWKGKIDPIAMTWVTIDLLQGYGDAAFKKVVDMPRRVTKKLGLNVVPTRLCYADVRVVIQTTAAILLELRDWHIAQPLSVFVGAVGFGNVVYRGGVTNFLDAASSLVP